MLYQGLHWAVASSCFFMSSFLVDNYGFLLQSSVLHSLCIIAVSLHSSVLSLFAPMLSHCSIYSDLILSILEHNLPALKNFVSAFWFLSLSLLTPTSASAVYKSTTTCTAKTSYASLAASFLVLTFVLIHKQLEIGVTLLLVTETIIIFLSETICSSVFPLIWIPLAPEHDSWIIIRYPIYSFQFLSLQSRTERLLLSLNAIKTDRFVIGVCCVRIYHSQSTSKFCVTMETCFGQGGGSLLPS
jgi:hypothetical protein